MINVKKNFRARGDGVTNDTVAFQKAINNAQRGDVIEIPEGTYLIDGVIINYGDFHFRGVGKEASKILQNDSNRTLIDICTDDEGVNIENLTLVGCINREQVIPPNPTFGAAPLIHASGRSLQNRLKRLTIRGCQLVDPLTVAIKMSWVDGGSIIKNWVYHYTDGILNIDDHVNKGPHVGIFSGNAPCRDILISHNHWSGNSRDDQLGKPKVGGAEGFIFATDWENCSVIGNIGRNAWLEWFHGTGGSWIIKGNVVVTRNAGVSSAGILFWQHVPGIECPDIVIQGNIFEGGDEGFGILMKTDVSQYQYTANITGNTIRNYLFGLGATNARILRVSDNLFDGLWRGFDNTNGPTTGNCGIIQLNDNMFSEMRDCAIFGNGLVDHLLQLHDNVIQSQQSHVWIYKDPNKPATPFSMKNNNFLDGDGKVVEPIYLWNQIPKIL